MVMYACNSSTWEAQVVGFQVQGQLELHSETPSQKKQTKITKD
jgi:hypothetical protein